MPLPKKLSKKAPKAKKKKVMAETMKELTSGPVNAPSRKATSGKQRQKQNVAIALQQAGMSNKKKAEKKRGK